MESKTGARSRSGFSKTLSPPSSPTRVAADLLNDLRGRGWRRNNLNRRQFWPNTREVGPWHGLQRTTRRPSAVLTRGKPRPSTRNGFRIQCTMTVAIADRDKGAGLLVVQAWLSRTQTSALHVKSQIVTSRVKARLSTRDQCGGLAPSKGEPRESCADDQDRSKGVRAGFSYLLLWPRHGSGDQS